MGVRIFYTLNTEFVRKPYEWDPDLLYTQPGSTGIKNRGPVCSLF